MGSFHYQAEFIKQDETHVVYKFYPDFISFESIFGEFQIELESWRAAIISETAINGHDSFYGNKRPVNTLTYKIKKYFEANREFPKTVSHIA